MQKNKVWRFFSWVPMLVMMRIIFGFSGQDGETSGGLSEKIGNSIVQIIDKVSRLELSTEEKEIWIEALQFPIRKSAHMMEYALLFLTILLPIIVWHLGKNRFQCYLFSWICTVLFACTDEFHQLFVPDRAGRIQDVCIDGIGAFICAIFLWKIKNVLKNQRDKKIV